MVRCEVRLETNANSNDGANRVLNFPSIYSELKIYLKKFWAEAFRLKNASSALTYTFLKDCFLKPKNVTKYFRREAFLHRFHLSTLGIFILKQVCFNAFSPIAYTSTTKMKVSDLPIHSLLRFKTISFTRLHRKRHTFLNVSTFKTV